MFAVSDVVGRFSCGNSSIRGEVTYSTFWEKGRLKKTGARALVRQTREMYYEVRFEETLSLNALRVIYPVILCNIG